MTNIEQFPQDVLSMLVALPFRVGLFVSRSDATGGQDSEDEELRALENIVTFFVEDTLKSEFAQKVMLLSLQQKNTWLEWQDHVGNVPSECHDIIGYLQDRMEPRDLLAFKNNLLEIAIAVAMAYRENQSENFLAKIKNRIDATWRNFKGRDKGHVAKAYTYFTNISKAEKLAINKLADAMVIPYELR